MLLALSLRDFVIVETLDLDFQNGLTVLTGETGAGRSITLDTLDLLLGGKADYSQIRSDAKEARLSALSNLSGLAGLQEELCAQGPLDEGSEKLSIRRITDAKGKSHSYINNQATTPSQLKTVGEQLIDTHGQNTHHSLNQESAQRRPLDVSAGSLEQAETVRQYYQSRGNAKKALHEARNQAENTVIERERLEWQFNELNQLGLKQGEWETLNQSHDSLAHAAGLLQAAAEIGETIDGDNGIQRQIYRCQKPLGSLQAIKPRFTESLNMLASIEAELGEISANMRDVASRIDIDPDELAKQEQRMDGLMGATRKYRVEPQDLPAKLEEIGFNLQNLHAVGDIAAPEAAVTRSEAEYDEAAQTLSAMRREAAARLGDETTGHMQHPVMKGAQFHIELLLSPPTAHGLEQVQYQISADRGSPPHPLNKVTSGGELARISLVPQVVTSRHTRVPTLIFDEVDTGIGGGVVETVDEALRALDGQHQVLVVTHLLQTAAYGENHWQVHKHSDGSQTVSRISVLNRAGRIEEIARMLGDEAITDTTRSHAAELLQLAAG